MLVAATASGYGCSLRGRLERLTETCRCSATQCTYLYLADSDPGLTICKLRGRLKHYAISESQDGWRIQGYIVAPSHSLQKYQ